MHSSLIALCWVVAAILAFVVVALLITWALRPREDHKPDPFRDAFGDMPHAALRGANEHLAHADAYQRELRRCALESGHSHLANPNISRELVHALAADLPSPGVVALRRTAGGVSLSIPSGDAAACSQGARRGN